MLDKSNKISVLNKMIGLGEEINPSYVVPQNSTNNFYQKAGLVEMKAKENSLKPAQKIASQCPHCENMAKNFLYLESLIRTNSAAHNRKSKCSVCDSSLCYLQYVNKSILEVFGNFDAIAEAAKAFSSGGDPSSKMMKRQVRKKLQHKKPSMKDIKQDSLLLETKNFVSKKVVKRNNQSKPKSNVADKSEPSKIESNLSGQCVQPKKKRMGKLLRHKKHMIRFLSKKSNVALTKKQNAIKPKFFS
ncbi:uncharacterized protein [Musca autumnalis]|uniref:uncharacterized protein n=1 Tax=Musca autumnalis TaxID=221902 RepID=UPI003CF97137